MTSHLVALLVVKRDVFAPLTRPPLYHAYTTPVRISHTLWSTYSSLSALTSDRLIHHQIMSVPMRTNPHKRPHDPEDLSRDAPDAVRWEEWLQRGDGQSGVADTCPSVKRPRSLADGQTHARKPIDRSACAAPDLSTAFGSDSSHLLRPVPSSAVPTITLEDTDARSVPYCKTFQVPRPPYKWRPRTLEILSGHSGHLALISMPLHLKHLILGDSTMHRLHHTILWLLSLPADSL